jgi:hypothetical protein
MTGAAAARGSISGMLTLMTRQMHPSSLQLHLLAVAFLEVDEYPLVGPGRCCSPRHGFPFIGTHSGPKCVR